MNLEERIKRKLHNKGFARDVCDVRGCSIGDTEVWTLLPLDPIDHEETIVKLCPEHGLWADERNQLASEVADELRAKRREIGDERFGEIQDLAVPQGDLREDILDGSADDGVIPLEEALE